MKSLRIILSILFLFLSIVRASESVDFNKLAEEKARIKANHIEELPTAPTKPTPGQLIFISTPKPTPVSTTTLEEKPVVTSSPTAQQKKSRKTGDEKKQPKKEKEQQEVDDNNSEEEEDKSLASSEKKDKKNKKRPSDSSSDNQDSEELPKRLFRPRFRAESSAEPLKISILITLSLSLLGVLFI